MNSEKYKRRIIKGAPIFYIGIVVFVVACAAINFLIHQDKREIMVKIAPYVSSVSIDGKSVNNNKTIWLTEGSHNVKAFYDGFEVFDEIITVTNESRSITAELLPITEAGRLTYNEHIEDYYELESYAGKTIKNEVESAKKYPILSVLPFITDDYSIGALREDERLTLTITLRNYQNTQIAINKLISLARENELSISRYPFRINNFINKMEGVDFLPSRDVEKSISDALLKSQREFTIRKIGHIDEYAYVLVQVKQNTGNNVLYRAIFKKDGEQWKIMATPQPILTVDNTPGASEEVLDKINFENVYAKEQD